MRGLVIEDERKVADFVARGLEAEQFSVDIARDGIAAWDFASRLRYDFIILDLLLPGLSGTEFLQRLRERGIQSPVLVLTARGNVADKIRHLEAGADDYLTKPFVFAELAVRIRALLRRTASVQPRLLTVGDLELDQVARQVRRDGRRIELTVREFALLEYMMLHAGQVLSRTLILEHVWDQSFEGLTNVVDVYVRYLRAKIDDPVPWKLIRTVRRVGYSIDAGEV